MLVLECYVCGVGQFWGQFERGKSILKNTGIRVFCGGFGVFCGYFERDGNIQKNSIKKRSLIQQIIINVWNERRVQLLIYPFIMCSQRRVIEMGGGLGQCVNSNFIVKKIKYFKKKKKKKKKKTKLKTEEKVVKRTFTQQK
eukprot:TRINITY_DN7324_c0_g1_i1.p4 TRINITY_DN7324_c0_g1~~TRINITY_DN7324_c0_g1_i1.p4  ORF type:complete len:141 (+),score=13.84 TRINITY_DN7324_c0_g1_i1:235-657(+)